MKIAYLILCHTDANHISRLVHKVTKGTDNHAFVHVDKKVDITPFNELLGKNHAATVLTNRTSVFWGGVFIN